MIIVTIVMRISFLYTIGNLTAYFTHRISVLVNVNDTLLAIIAYIVAVFVNAENHHITAITYAVVVFIVAKLVESSCAYCASVSI